MTFPRSAEAREAKRLAPPPEGSSFSERSRCRAAASTSTGRMESLSRRPGAAGSTPAGRGACSGDAPAGRARADFQEARNRAGTVEPAVRARSRGGRSLQLQFGSRADEATRRARHRLPARRRSGRGLRPRPRRTARSPRRREPPRLPGGSSLPVDGPVRATRGGLPRRAWPNVRASRRRPPPAGRWKPDHALPRTRGPLQNAAQQRAIAGGPRHPDQVPQECVGLLPRRGTAPRYAVTTRSRFSRETELRTAERISGRSPAEARQAFPGPPRAGSNHSPARTPPAVHNSGVFASETIASPRRAPS